MASVTQQTIATGNTLGHVTRPARALIGWMQQPEAQLMLAQRMVQLAGDQSHVDRASAARQTVAARPPLVEELHVLSEPGQDLAAHIASLVAQPDYQPFVAEGWTNSGCLILFGLDYYCREPVVIDLAKVEKKR